VRLPGLEALVARNLRLSRLRFTTDIPEAVRASDVIFIAVGTPPDEDGSADLQPVLDAAKTIGAVGFQSRTRWLCAEAVG